MNSGMSADRDDKNDGWFLLNMILPVWTGIVCGCIVQPVFFDDGYWITM